jgi:hypothetical protein
MNVEKTKKKRLKNKLKGNKLYLCFMDCQKAFDRVKHNKLLEGWHFRTEKKINH